jgi:hypothetical protein
LQLASLLSHFGKLSNEAFELVLDELSVFFFHNLAARDQWKKCEMPNNFVATKNHKLLFQQSASKKPLALQI